MNRSCVALNPISINMFQFLQPSKQTIYLETVNEGEKITIKDHQKGRRGALLSENILGIK